MDDRPVPVPRSDASARDFWCRMRDSEECSPVDKFKVRAPLVVAPYARQRPPTFAQRPAPPTGASRIVERAVYRDALAELENRPPLGDATATHRLERDVARLRNQAKTLLAENVRLRETAARTQAHLQRALRINHALTAEMVRDVRTVQRDR